MFFSKVVSFVAMFFVVMVVMLAQGNPVTAAPGIVINLPSRTLALYSDNALVKEYPVAIGKPSTPTPLGNYAILYMEANPAWIPPGGGIIVPSGPDNPLGYRWMGFTADYGIHGTNAPWSIGSAVSNGCIRMYEEDAEELYNTVNIGTPVKVTYDRVKIRIDNNGQASIGIYPDVYGYQEVNTEYINNKLAEYYLKGLASNELLAQIIQGERSKQVPFAQLSHMRINNKILPRWAVNIQGSAYVPVWAIAEALKTNITWDEQKGLVQGEKRSVNGIVKGDILYVTPENIQVLFGGQQSWNKEDNCLDFDFTIVVVNGKVITRNVQMVEGIIAVPAMEIAKATGQPAKWDGAKNTLTIQGKNVPVSLVDKEPFIKINQINEYFNAFVYWNQLEHTIEITYPLGDPLKVKN